MPDAEQKRIEEIADCYDDRVDRGPAISRTEKCAGGCLVTLSDHSNGLLQLNGPLARSLSGSAKIDVGERTMLLQALTAANWNRTEAARRLHWSRMTLYRKMIRYQVGPSIKPRSRFSNQLTSEN